MFIIIDTDDCNENLKEKYISGEIFQNHILQKYIVPIYNISNLEDIMLKTKIVTKRISTLEKGYTTIKFFL